MHEFNEFPLTILFPERQLGLESVGYAAKHENLLRALGVFLSVDNVVDESVGQFGSEARPLPWLDGSGHGAEVVVGVRPGEHHRVVHMTVLEGGVGGKLVVELQERGILVLIKSLVAYALQHPFALTAEEEIPIADAELYLLSTPSTGV